MDLGPEELGVRQRAAELAMLNMGITFNVYSDSGGLEKIFPFDVVPRVVPADDWALLQRGLEQRIRALNLFVDDIYNDQKIIKDGIVPREIIKSSKAFLPRGKIWRS